MRGNYLIGLLVCFGILILAGLVRIMTAEPHAYAPRESAVAAVPHRPAEFPAVFDFDPLEGLSEASGGLHVHPPPPSNPDTWPCSDCHERGKDKDTRRELVDEHDTLVLAHGSPERLWCLDCHDFDDRDKLRLSGGSLLAFEESNRLCAQCHGQVAREWEVGIHGKRTGYWNGAKRALSCASCHDPHAPKFKAKKPLPPPVRPEFYRRDADRRERALREASLNRPAAPTGEEH